MGSTGMLRLSIAALVIVAWAAPGSAGDEKKAKKGAARKEAKAAPAVRADEKSAALLDKAEAQRYLLGAEGVKKASCTGASDIQPRDGKPAKTGFRYEWDGTGKTPKGKVAMDAGSEAKGMQPGVPDEDMLDGFFAIKESWRQEFAGCKLTAAEEGERTKISVEGKNERWVTAIVLDADAMPVELAMAPPLASTMTWKMAFEKIGAKFLLKKMTITAGPMTPMDIAIEYGKSGKYTVPVKITMKQAILITATTITSLKDWKLEDGAAPAAKTGKAVKSAKKAAKVTAPR